MIDDGYIPENKFDWSFKSGEFYKKIDFLDEHSSISSCSLKIDEDSEENIQIL